VKFELAHQVTIDRPVDEVFPVLALSDDLERVLRLSPMVRSFRLVSVEPSTSAAEQVITFEFGEEIRSTEITMRVQQNVDTRQRRVDYWSQTKVGIPVNVHKVRTFEAVGDATRVSEAIHGHAPFGLHLVAKRIAQRAHVEHMESYGRLFEG
jgi:hypothetical protein